VQTAFAFMAALAADTKCSQFLYHATMNLIPGERLTRPQWQKAIDQLEKELGLTGHYRVAFEHIKKDRQHYHIVWCRLPPGGGRAVNMGNDFYVHQKVAIALEKEFGLKPSPRKGRDKPSHKKQEINNRNDKIRINPDIVKKEATLIYRQSQSGKEFLNSLTKAGYTLTRGKNDSLVLVDKKGGYHGLLRRLEGVTAKDFHKKFQELEKAPLPSLSATLRSRRPVSIGGFFKKVARAFTIPGRIHAPGFSGGKRNRNRLSSLANLSGGNRGRNKLFTVPRFGNLAALIASARKYIPREEKKHYPPPIKRKRRRKKDENIPDSEKMPFRRPEWESAEVLAWAWENGRLDVLAEFGVFLELDSFEP
jgi:hypothetical protein